MLELPPLALYIHIPWCVRKCPYCDFNSHEFAGELPQQQYIAALCADLEQEKQRCGDREIYSIFIGGGTPSLFDASAFAELLSFIRDNFKLAEHLEITLEANPGTAEAGRFNSYRESGINRLSLGIQSFDDLQLQKLGRIHDAEQAATAISLARSAGFDNFNLDLMHGLPGQTVQAALEDLYKAVASQPPHLSWYQLTIEPNTVFYRKPPPLPHESLVEDMTEAGKEYLAGQGLMQYEVSAYARPGHVSLHNRNYWSFGDYIGVGAGAHGKLSEPDQDRIIRTRKIKQPRHYLDAPGSRDAEILEIPQQQRSLEFLMNALRLRKGFTREQFQSRSGLTFDHIAKRVEYLISQGLLTEIESYIRTTDKGYNLLNSVLQEFL